MKRLRILCSLKSDLGNQKKLITHVGGVNGSGERWTISNKEAISGLHSGHYEFYIVEKFKELKVTIEGVEFPTLFSSGNGLSHNLLEDLPDCS